MVSEKLNIAGNTLFNNEKEIIATNDEIKVLNNENEIINTTTTTVPTLQNTYEEEMQTSLNFKLPDSDGVDIYSSKISIYSTEEQTVLSKLIPGVSLESGCIVEEIQELQNQWINIIEANSYSKEKIINNY